MTDLLDFEEAIADRAAAGDINIPPYPAVATRLQALLNRTDYTVKELAKLLSTDQSLAASVLRQANSAFYGAAGQVQTLQQAIVRIGSKDLVQIALAATLGKQACSVGPLQDLKFLIWRQAVVAAALNMLLARLRGLDPNEGFTSGLLHDFGKTIALACIEEELQNASPALDLSRQSWLQLVERFHVVLGLSMAAEWRLPEQLCEVIANHHRPLEDQVSPLTEVVRQCDRIGHLVETQIEVTQEDLAALSGLSGREAQRLSQLLPTIPSFVASLTDLSVLGAGPSPATKSALEKPRSTLVGRERPVDFAITCFRAGDEFAFRAVIVTADGLVMMGAQPLQENALVRLRLEHQEVFDIWANVALCKSQEDGYSVEAVPFALDGGVKHKWLALCEGEQ